MANGDPKYCPLIRQGCIKNQCEFFHEVLKKCEISLLSYNTYRLAASTKPNAQSDRNRRNPSGGDFSNDKPLPRLPQYDRIEPQF